MSLKEKKKKCFKKARGPGVGKFTREGRTERERNIMLLGGKRTRREGRSRPDRSSTPGGGMAPQQRGKKMFPQEREGLSDQRECRPKTGKRRFPRGREKSNDAESLP